MHPEAAKDWNVVVSAHPQGWRPALRALRRRSRAHASGHDNVLVAATDDPLKLLNALEAEAESHPVLVHSISRVAPAQACFEFTTDDEFERQAETVALPWLPQLAGRSFHVRIHRRGAGLTARSHETEARLGAALLDALAMSGASARIDFDDPDLVLAIDAIDGRAGMGLWTRDQLRDHRFLRPD